MAFTSELPYFKAALGDWDKTFAIDKASDLAALETIGELKTLFELSDEDVAARLARLDGGLDDTVRSILGKLFPDDPIRYEIAHETYHRHFDALHLDNAGLMDGALDTLAIFAVQDMPFGFASNKTQPHLEQGVNEFLFNCPRAQARLGPWLGRVRLVGDNGTCPGKPAPDFLYRAADQLGIELGPDVLFIGDARQDVEAALRAGCFPVLFGPENIDRVKPLAEIATVGYVENHAALQRALRRALARPPAPAVQDDDVPAEESRKRIITSTPDIG